MRLALPALVGTVVIGSAAAAFAHAHLLQAQPPAEAAFHTSPKLLRLTFSEPLVLNFSGVQVEDAAGHVVPTGKPGLDPTNKRVLILPLRSALPAGAYTVRWRAVSADTHRVEGRYALRIVP